MPTHLYKMATLKVMLATVLTRDLSETINYFDRNQAIVKIPFDN